MSVVTQFPQSEGQYNPLDEFEELLEASPYDFERPTDNRLHFQCAGKQGDYTIMLEWNEDVRVVKSVLVIESTRKLSTPLLEQAIQTANEGAWHGFFAMDGVGHTVFKCLIKLNLANAEEYIFALEDSIDAAIREADRFSLSLSLPKNDANAVDLFAQDENKASLENLDLMFSEPQGNA